MKSFSAIALIFCALPIFSAAAQEAPAWELQSLSRIMPGAVKGTWESHPTTEIYTGTNGVWLRYGNETLTADSMGWNLQSGEAVADGHVRV